MSETTYGNTVKHTGKAAHDAIHSTAESTDEMSRRIGDAAADAGAAVQDAMRKTYAAATDFGHEAVERGKRYGKDVVGHVESQPMTSVMVAASVGFIAGLLLARR